VTEAISIRTLLKGTIILLSGEVGLPRYARNDKGLLRSGYPGQAGVLPVFLGNLQYRGFMDFTSHYFINKHRLTALYFPA
jgi:hypothetical protein